MASTMNETYNCSTANHLLGGTSRFNSSIFNYSCAVPVYFPPININSPLNTTALNATTNISTIITISVQLNTTAILTSCCNGHTVQPYTNATGDKSCLVYCNNTNFEQAFFTYSCLNSYSMYNTSGMWWEWGCNLDDIEMGSKTSGASERVGGGLCRGGQMSGSWAGWVVLAGLVASGIGAV